MPIRAVLDNNLPVSRALGGGPTIRRLFELWDLERFVAVASPPILAELRGVLDRMWRRGQLADDPEPFLDMLEQRVELAPGATPVGGVCRDPDDDKFLSCAVEANADYLVTGDGDLLALDPFRGIRIVTPRAFVELLDAAESG